MLGRASGPDPIAAPPHQLRRTRGHTLSVMLAMRTGTGKALANERKYPFVVELPITGEGLEVALNHRIVEFHTSRNIQPRHGRTIFRHGGRYYRWCFSDLPTARAFLEQFGGELLQRSI